MMTDRYMFRGKRLDNGEWIIGGYAYTNIIGGELGIPVCISDCIKHHLIFVSGHYYDIDPSTLGQCTGLRDENGKLIFEGDVFVDEFKKDDIFKGVVGWSAHNLTWVGRDTVSLRHTPMCEFTAEDCISCRTLEIIGNIHDNPELLAGAERSGDE